MAGIPEPTLVEIKKNDSGVFEVYRSASEAEALAFLRRRDVRQAKYYVIVETPLRNIGRDLIGIFEEPSGAPIEFPKRTPLPQPVPSQTNCARCGYEVLPAKRTESFTSDAGTVQVITTNEEMMEKGLGNQCTRCGSLACASCYQATLEEIARDATGQLNLTCWVCGGPVDTFYG